MWISHTSKRYSGILLCVAYDIELVGMLTLLAVIMSSIVCRWNKLFQLEFNVKLKNEVGFSPKTTLIDYLMTIIITMNDSNEDEEGAVGLIDGRHLILHLG